MKNRALLFGFIFSLLGIQTSAQVVEKYKMGFEATGETYGYHVGSGTAAPQSVLYSSGSRALKIEHTATQTIIMLDTIDLTTNSNFQNCLLEFSHIANINPFSVQSATHVATIECKLANATTWNQVTNDKYDILSGPHSTEFEEFSSFSRKSYTAWQNSVVDNTCWKRERFNMWAAVGGAAGPNRKLLIRFVLAARTTSTAPTATEGWYIDNIRVTASPQSLAIPVISMLKWPDAYRYPHSRAARIEAKITTPVMAGLNSDSLYIMYRYGHDDSIRYLPLNQLSGNRYYNYIPFEGYDTTVYYRVVARDATLNANANTYPSERSQWAKFCFVRGYKDSLKVGNTSLTSNSNFPFSAYARTRNQMYYDSATLAAAGHRPGAITKLQLKVLNNISSSNRDRFIIKMHNVGGDFATTEQASGGTFYGDDMITVYDSALRISQNAGTIRTIRLQDTFFYSGAGLLIQTYTINANSDPVPVPVECVPCTPTSKTIAVNGYTYLLDYDVFTAVFNSGDLYDKRPNFVIGKVKNLPLRYDVGISGFVAPSATVPAAANVPNTVNVWLKNFGSTPLNAVRIYYQVDDSASKYYNWSGTLAPFDSVNVTVSTNQFFAPGHHYLHAWVGDSVTIGTRRYRDHEPSNDSCHTRFVSCQGPMNGVRYVGGANADYRTLEEFIYSANLCGVNGVLTVKLAGGVYAPHTFLSIPGASHTNYVQFEPANPSDTVTFANTIANGANVNYLINLQRTKYLRFKNIKFVSYSASNANHYLTPYPARLSISSTDIHFINCIFREERGSSTMSNTSTIAHIYSGGADSLTVDGCSFYRGTVGISGVGPAEDNLAKGLLVKDNYFTMQKNTAIEVRNQRGAVVEHNNVNQVSTNASYILLFRNCFGPTRIVRNTVYSTTGASCLGVTDLHGDSAAANRAYAVVANNMLVSNDDGQSNMLTTVLNVIRGSFVKVVYNSVKLNAPSRGGIAAATLGGDTIYECLFYNNIVSCVDTANFAFNYIPYEGGENYIGYNIYYSRSPLMNKYEGIGCATLGEWQNLCVADTASQQVSPAFLNATVTDLRSYSQNVKGKGLPIAEVSNDINDTVRHATNPCVGAFEFHLLSYDFEIADIVTPYEEYCGGNGSDPLKVVIKNSGVTALNSTAASGITLHYVRGLNPSAGNVSSVPVVCTVPALDTVEYNTSVQLAYPPNGRKDTTYYFTLWLTSGSIDFNPANDTTQMAVTMRYKAPAPTPIATTVQYAHSTTVVANSGIETWYPEVFNTTAVPTARVHKSQIYWYTDSLGTQLIQRGDTLVTDLLYRDTTYYIRQKRDLPVVKITQVQFNRTGSGATYPMPFFMHNNTSFAVELTNVGDYPANLAGDTLMTIANTNARALHNKIYVFPAVTLAPGATLVVQFISNVGNIDSSITLGTPGLTLSAASTSSFAVLYRDGKGVADAVPFNGYESDANWTAAGVRSAVWTGTGIQMPANSAGIYRKGFPQSATSAPSYFSQYWQTADSVHSMRLGTFNPNLLLFVDNGCVGDLSPVSISMVNQPDVDLSVDSIDIPVEHCNLGITSLDLNIHNYGTTNSGAFMAYLAVNDTLVCADNISAIGSLQSVQHTFSQPVDFTVYSGSREFRIKAWVDNVTGDVIARNDTTQSTVVSSYTPGAPVVTPSVTVVYSQQATLQLPTPTSDSLIWYDHNMNPLDTCSVYYTSRLYEKDSFYVAAVSVASNYLHIGTLSTTTAASSYPSPYNLTKNNVKEQYIFTAEELIAAGHGAGIINEISFYLDTLMTQDSTITFSMFDISMGATTATEFSANNDWAAVSTKYSSNSVTLERSKEGWQTHSLDVPYHWDGVSNVVVQVCHKLPTVQVRGLKTKYTETSGQTVLYFNDNVTANVLNYSGNGSRANRRPDIRFGFADLMCQGPTSKINVEVTGVPNADASIVFPTQDSTVSLTSCAADSFNVVVSNRGLQGFSNYTVDYWVDGEHQGSVVVSATLPVHTDTTITVGSLIYKPGRHQLMATVSLTGDSISQNDTVRTSIVVKFCGGTYTIGHSAGNDYASFDEASAALNVAGIAGSVTFNVESGTYQEQLRIGAVEGTSQTKIVTFKSATDNASDVVVTYPTTQNANYVVLFSGASHVALSHMSVFANPGNGNYGNAIVVNGSEDIRLVGDSVIVKSSINNTNANGLVINDNVRNLRVENCVFNNGYAAITSKILVPGSSEGLTIQGNKLRNFYYYGISLRQIKGVNIRDNDLFSALSSGSRGQGGILVAEHNGATIIERNYVGLMDNTSGGKRGIMLVNVLGSNSNRSLVSNNMVSCKSRGLSGFNPAGGILIDSSSHVNVFYNTVRTYAGHESTSRNLRSFSVDHNSTSVHVMNNIFDNRSAGYAFYAMRNDNVGMVNYNVYYSDTVGYGTDPRLAYFGWETPTFQDFVVASGKNENSLEEMPYYVSDTNLHLAFSQFNNRAQYNTVVPNDIDHEIRPQIPAPCIGADEPSQYLHDVTLMEIVEPGLSTDRVRTDNIESLPLRIVTIIYNNGSSVESNLSWDAQVRGTSPLCQSVRKNILEMQPNERIYDTTYINMPIGVIDTQTVKVQLYLEGDLRPENNVVIKDFFLDPAYNIQTDEVFYNDTLSGVKGCRLGNMPVSVKITNVGRLDIPVTWPIQIGFESKVVTQGVTVPQFPISSTEAVVLTEPLPRLASTIVNLTHTANVYPTGTDKDIVVKLRAFALHPHDQKQFNDTSQFKNITSKYTPHSPVGVNLNIPYATWDTIFASQTDNPVGGVPVHRPIRWHMDSTSAPFLQFTDYNPSTWWETPQYYQNAVYYLSCISTTGCTSYYNPVHVTLNPRVGKDAAAQWLEQPYDQVYMDDDTVKVRVFNYGAQMLTNIPAVYQLRSGSGTLLQEVRETFNVSLAPDSSTLLAFDSLMQLANTNETRFVLRAWVDMPDEQTRGNDTVRREFTFNVLPESTYPIPDVSSIAGFDITHVAFAGLNSYVAPAGHTYLNLAQRANPKYPVLHLVKGTTDTLIIEGENVDNSNDTSTSAGITVLIDFNRDGKFEPAECILFDTLKSRHTIKFPFTYPYVLPSEFRFDTSVYRNSAEFSSRRPSLGYVRMRVIAEQEHYKPEFDSMPSFQFGSIHDYLLYVEDQPLDVDLAASRIVSPVKHFIETHDSIPTVVTFMMANKGANTVTSANIIYTFTDDSNSVTDTLHWTGSVDKGRSVPVALPAHRFIKGTTSVRIIVKAAGDINVANDTLYYDYHRFHVIELLYKDNFEYATPNLWYAPQGYTPYSKNVWQRGKVKKTNIIVAHGDSCVLATDTAATLNFVQTGNVSVIYSPIINISQVRPDTLRLWLASDMGDSTYVKLQFLDYLDNWQDLRPQNLELPESWYNESYGFVGRTSGYSYNEYRLSLKRFADDFQQKLQFRIIYLAHPGCGRGEGAVIDDFEIGRAQRAIDVGVTNIVYPTAPRFGETIRPRVLIKNFGYDTIRRISLAYDVYGQNLPKVGLYVSDTGIAPNGGVAMFTFPDPFIVRSDFPDTFKIAAYTTVNSDIYWNNDTTEKEFYLTPLDNDLGMVAFASPMDRIVAGDSIVVTTRIRNFGQAPVSNTTLTYVYNKTDTVREHIDFVETIGRPLGTFEYYNYTFRHKKRASMGTMYLTAYTTMPNDDYVFNDTISKTLTGMASIVDLKAREIVLDSSDFQVWKVLLVVDNVGAIATNNFEVGYWYDNDPSTMVVERHNNGMPLAALASAYHTFADTLRPRPAGYDHITAFVHVPNDNDPSNDTTKVIVDQYRDPYPVVVYVEENRTDSCHVRVMVKNGGNATFNKPINIKVTINGETLQHIFRDKEVAPGPMYSFDMPGTISKSPTRTYQGEARFAQKPSTDRVGENNQTSWIEVKNYLDTDAIPSAQGLVKMRLEQNRPNPFTDFTYIDFYIPESGNVTFYVMDVMGRIVHRETRFFSAGDNVINYHADRLNTGTYYYGIEKDGQRLMRKMVFKR
ncbi:MAG: T9SS type A sorting domain-containing protein [Bacteroidales bacterium]|nr:T9SS type A sorting domain-containing protein [Bacteroidales bacterium]